MTTRDVPPPWPKVPEWVIVEKPWNGKWWHAWKCTKTGREKWPEGAK